MKRGLVRVVKAGQIRSMIGPGPARMLSTTKMRFSGAGLDSAILINGPGPPNITELCNTNSVEPLARSMLAATLPRTRVLSRRIRDGLGWAAEDSTRTNANDERAG